MQHGRPWKRLGERGSAGLDLPPRRARDLALAHGWRAVAGEGLAAHVAAEAVRGGVLELTTEGKPWRDAVLPAIPELASRLAALHPQLGVRKVRLRLTGEAEPPPPAMPIPGAVPAPKPARHPAAVAAPEPPDDAPVLDRLSRLADRYLERRGRRVD